MRLHATLAAAAIALSACTLPQPPETPIAGDAAISAVSVQSDVRAVGDRDAARFWGNLGSDIESAIATEFVGQTGPGGLAIAVDIDELSLATLLAAQPGQDARLTGTVVVTDPATGAASGTYTVSASASQAMDMMGVPAQARVQIVPATSDQFYQAVVSAFARGVAEVVRGGGTLRAT